MIGNRYGRLTVMARADKPASAKTQGVYLSCKCACGAMRVVLAGSLRRGATQSCGCQRKEKARLNIRKAWGKGTGNLRHGLAKTAEWHVWCDIRKRCSNPNSRAFKDYGGRGITVDPRWATFDGFIASMGQRPTPKHTLERHDNNGPYSPENCRWATRTEQARNRRTNRLVTVRGVTRPLVTWGEITGIPWSRIQSRLNAGWTPERAVEMG